MEQDVLEEESGEAAGEIGDGAPGAGALAAVCLSCGAGVVGVFCASCGQKNDDLRRSSFVLAKDFLRDTFGFDSRMWRTLGLMALAPGTVPSDYAHGKRSRYTPPVRLFIVVSFLFFLTLGLTQTLFVAFEVIPKSPEQIAAEQAALERARKIASDAVREESVTVLTSEGVCDVNLRFRNFIRSEDVRVDEAAWRDCAEKIQRSASLEITLGEGAQEEGVLTAQESFSRLLAGLTAAIENPNDFNSRINTWLPRVMFLMTPVLALILALFIRGRDALLFDHLVLAFYMHAVWFAIVILAVLASQMGVPHAGPAAASAMFIYFLIATKRAYNRGWIKTVWTAAIGGVLYLTALSGAVLYILWNVVWNG